MKVIIIIISFSHYIDDDGKIASVDDESYPNFLTFIVKIQEDFDSKFKDFPHEVDFEKDMILIYAFTSITSKERSIRTIKLENQTLKIDYKTAKSSLNADDAHAPGCIILVVKMDRLDIDMVEFVSKK